MNSHVVKEIKKTMNHKKYRSFLKKQRRKRIRQQKAKMRENEEDIENFLDENENTTDDLLQSINCETEDTLKWIQDEDERIKQHRLWLEREIEAQIRFQNEKNMRQKQEQEEESLEEAENVTKKKDSSAKNSSTVNVVEVMFQHKHISIKIILLPFINIIESFSFK